MGASWKSTQKTSICDHENYSDHKHAVVSWEALHFPPIDFSIIAYVKNAIEKRACKDCHLHEYLEFIVFNDCCIISFERECQFLHLLNAFGMLVND